MSYRGSTKNVGQIGAELDAVYVVESSVRKHGEGLRVASRLIRVADQTSSAGWSETFDHGASAGDLQQTRAATRLARLIALELAPASVSDRPTKATSDSTAWDAFLKGKALMNSGSAANIRQALLQFETAAKQDPSFAAAWAKIAETRHVLVMVGALSPGDRVCSCPHCGRARARVGSKPRPMRTWRRGWLQLWNDWRPTRCVAVV